MIFIDLQMPDQVYKSLKWKLPFMELPEALLIMTGSFVKEMWLQASKVTASDRLDGNSCSPGVDKGWMYGKEVASH